MAKLRIDFQDGFSHDVVVIRGAGPEMRKDDVTTLPQISYAGSVETTVELKRLTLEIAVPTKDLSDRTDIDVDSDAIYVGVSIDNGELSYRISREPFAYL